MERGEKGGAILNTRKKNVTKKYVKLIKKLLIDQTFCCLPAVCQAICQCLEIKASARHDFFPQGVQRPVAKTRK